MVLIPILQRARFWNVERHSSIEGRARGEPSSSRESKSVRQEAAQADGTGPRPSVHWAMSSKYRARRRSNRFAWELERQTVGSWNLNFPPFGKSDKNLLPWKLGKDLVVFILVKSGFDRKDSIRFLVKSMLLSRRLTRNGQAFSAWPPKSLNEKIQLRFHFEASAEPDRINPKVVNFSFSKQKGLFIVFSLELWFWLLSRVQPSDLVNAFYEEGLIQKGQKLLAFSSSCSVTISQNMCHKKHPERG